jgi:diacylglycerol kinase family enzyme
VDGEYLGPLPVRFTVTDALLRVVVPAAFPAPENHARALK